MPRLNPTPHPIQPNPIYQCSIVNHTTPHARYSPPPSTPDITPSIQMPSEPPRRPCNTPSTPRCPLSCPPPPHLPKQPSVQMANDRPHRSQRNRHGGQRSTHSSFNQTIVMAAIFFFVVYWLSYSLPSEVCVTMQIRSTTPTYNKPHPLL